MKPKKRTVMKQVQWVVAVLAVAAVAPAQDLNCAQVQQQLLGMQMAQAHLLRSFVEKNESMAKTLDQHALHLKSAKKYSNSASSQVKALKSSAASFREHRLREAALIQRFEKASQEVIQQSAKCFAQKRLDQVADQSIQKLGQR